MSSVMLRKFAAIIFIFFCLKSNGQITDDTKFERITTAQGLSNDQVNDIHQDQNGFIWIGTLSGLNRYDGYEIKNYYREDGNPQSIKNNTVVWIEDGPVDKLWIKSNEEISIFDPLTEQFASTDKYLEILQTDETFINQLLLDQSGDTWFSIQNRGLIKLGRNGEIISFNNLIDSDVSLASNNVSDIKLGNKGNLWVAHQHGVIEVIDIRSNKIIRKYALPEGKTKVEQPWQLFLDSDNDLWMYSSDDLSGLFFLNTQKGSSLFFDDSELSSTLIRGIVQNENGDIWVGSDHGGITVIDKRNWSMRFINNDPDNEKSLGNNNVTTLFKDETGGIWVGTTKGGVSYYHRRVNNFSHCKINKKELAYNDMSSFARGPGGQLWVGTNGKGVLVFNRDDQSFEVVEGRYPGKIPDVVVSMLHASDGRIWIGSYLDGLYVFDDNKFSKTYLVEDEPAVRCSVWELFEDSRGNLWIGTLTKGVYKYDLSTGEKINYSQTTGHLNANYVTTIAEDNKGQIWLGTGSGLSRYDPHSDSFELFYNSNDPASSNISDNSIISISIDNANRIWVATLNGLNLYNEETNDFTVFREKDGLSSNIILAIEQDDMGNIWMSTSHGLTKMIFNVNGYEFQTFGLSDGLQGENFTPDASYKTSDGELIFSGQNGLNIFNPSEIVSSDSTTNLLLTGFYISNKKILPGGDDEGGVLDQPINKTKEVLLDHDQNSVAFEFVAISYFQSGKIRYQYMLEGFDDDWVNVISDARKANYTNLDYGHYTFKVRSSGNPGAWSDEVVAVDVYIQPPFWQTPIAYVIYAILLVVLLYFTRSSIVKRERKKAEIENERREAERQHQLDLMKIKFFTNISHEFRTPLSLVLTPIERMIKNPDQVKSGDLNLVQRNAKRLLNLVNQLLDFRKMEANQHILNQSTGDLVVFMKDVVDSFSDLSKEKDIKLQFESELRSYFTLFDKDKMEKVMFNLLSNAFKFTMPGGQIMVDMEKQQDGKNSNIAIMVSDTGIGIPEEKQDLIFNRFFQNELNGDIINNGTGIGLAITREFVELHGGKISVESQPELGSTFTVDLPLVEVSSDEQVADELVKELVKSVENQPEEEESKNDLPNVLLVEDNFDFRFYLKDNLKQYFNVFVASNGKEAWKIVLNQHPDIVISDVMMPVMDGLQLCEKIKGDPRTLHIPVILLTAQSSDQHKIKGLEAGAIEYVSKPFNFEILISSINSALKFQRRVKESNNHIKAEPREIDVESMDQKLITKAIEIVEQNMSNSEFSVEDLSHELGFSRGHFYQKILKITGETPIDFIRNIRMKRAAELLLKTQYNVSEVAYKVGYNNPKLFSRYFKSKYNEYPSQYKTRKSDQED